MSEMTPVNNSHDAYFKATFGKIDFAKAFLNNYLSKELINYINIESLAPEPTTYLTKELKEQFTDLIYKAEIAGENAYITFLLEHKSYSDRMVIFQVLKYIINIWEEKIRNEAGKKKIEETTLKTADIELPIIIPLVVYHDKNKWKINRSLGEMIINYKNLPEIIKKYIPNYEYLLIDLSPPQEYDKINLEAEHAIVIEALSRARYETKEQVREIFKRAIIIYTRVKDKDIASYYIIETISYIISTRDDISKTELKTLADQVSEEGGEIIMTLAERLREEGRQEARQEAMTLAERLIERGRQEARQEAMTLAEKLREEGRQEARQEAMTLAEKLREEGIEKGIEKNRREMAKNFLRKGLSAELVAEASELPLEEVLKFKKEIEN